MIVFVLGVWLHSDATGETGNIGNRVGLWERKYSSLFYIFWCHPPSLFSPFSPPCPFFCSSLLLLYECILLLLFVALLNVGELSRKSIIGGKKRLACCHHLCKACPHKELTDFWSHFFPLEFCDF